jgi:hypothetical protein
MKLKKDETVRNERGTTSHDIARVVTLPNKYKKVDVINDEEWSVLVSR